MYLSFLIILKLIPYVNYHTKKEKKNSSPSMFKEVLGPCFLFPIWPNILETGIYHSNPIQI